MSGAPFLPYGRQLIEEDDVDAVAAVLRSGSLTSGPAVERFERALEAATGGGHAVACSSGTAALHLAALAAGLGPGERAIVPAVTFLATANAVRYTGAEVVFADVDPDSGLITAATAEAAARRAGGPVRAVFPVHLAGQFGDLPALSALARARGWTVIEDACHALGTRYRLAGGFEGRVGDGRWSDAAVFSFHPVKTVAMGEGGAVVADDAALAARAAALRNHGVTRDPARFLVPGQGLDADGRALPWYYEMAEPGFNYRASELHCALGVSQLAKLERFATRRRALAARYDAALAPLAPLVRPTARTPGVSAAWHLYVVLIDFAAAGVPRETVMERLRAAGIGTQVHYIPVPWQPYYRERSGVLELPGAERYYRRCLTLPLFPAMADDDVARVAGALAAALEIGA